MTCSGLLHGACSSWCAVHTQQGTPSSAEALQAQWCRRAEPTHVVWSLVLLQGDAGQLIVDIAQKEGADILVLGACIGSGVSTPAPSWPSGSRHEQRHCLHFLQHHARQVPCTGLMHGIYCYPSCSLPRAQRYEEGDDGQHDRHRHPACQLPVPGGQAAGQHMRWRQPQLTCMPGACRLPCQHGSCWALCNALSLLLLQIGAGDTYRMKTAAQPQVPVSGSGAMQERACDARPMAAAQLCRFPATCHLACLVACCTILRRVC